MPAAEVNVPSVNVSSVVPEAWYGLMRHGDTVVSLPVVGLVAFVLGVVGGRKGRGGA